jgi:arylsulfatase A
VIVILADDLGYGDVGCFNPESKVPTPNIDKLATQGMRFTDAHSPAAVCTPARYSVLTGRMAFRSKLGEKVVFEGAGGPCLIEKERLTLPGMLRQQGYTTAAFGKWHIGLTFLDKNGAPIKNGDNLAGVRKIDYSRAIPDAPIHRGFDHFYGTACCPTTDWLYAYIDGDRIPVPPTELLDESVLPKHEYGIWIRRGMQAPGFDMEEVDMVFLKKSVDFINAHAKKTPEKPFFLYHSTQAVHLPSFPGKKFKGKTKAGPHGDFIFEFDYIVGELMATLERNGMTDNTIVVVASDNGPEIMPVHHMRKHFNHDSTNPWRGVKRDDYEGGHRTPFIVRWPKRVKAATVSDQMTSLTDLMATFAEVTGASLPNNAAEDSYSMLPVLLGKDTEPVRQYMIQQAFRGSVLSIREGKWKYLDHKGSGGYNYPNDKKDNFPGQLYNLKDDPKESLNLYGEHPDIVKKLKAKLEEFKKSGRSAPRRSRQ